VAIAVDCPHCGKQLRVKDELAAARKVPQCQQRSDSSGKRRCRGGWFGAGKSRWFGAGKARSQGSESESGARGQEQGQGTGDRQLRRCR